MRGTCTCDRFPDEHPRQALCGIGFNGFLGEVQHRLIKLGYEPPLWPQPHISDQGDMDEALDVCVQWCAARLDEAKALRPEVGALVEAFNSGVHAGYMSNGDHDLSQRRKEWLATLSATDALTEVELTALIDYHDNQDAAAEAAGHDDAALYHAMRSSTYAAARDEIRKSQKVILDKMLGASTDGGSHG